MPIVDYDELESAMMFVSAGVLFDASARISKETGQIFWLSEESHDEEPFPDDIDDDDRYVDVPSQRDLDLGQRLVLQFVRERFSDHYDEVRGMFRRKGAYSRLKALLDRHGMLEEWYEYERAALRSALCEWARKEGIEVNEVAGDSTA